MSAKKTDVLLSIIIVSYNTAEVTIQTLKSTIKDVAASKLLRGNTELFVVDNNSSDDSVPKITALAKKTTSNLFTRFKIIPNKENLGFAKANNQAIKLSHGQYVLLLNSDTLVQPGALDNLLQSFLENSQFPEARLGIVAASLLNPDLSEQRQGGDLPSLASLCSQFFFLDDIPGIGKLLGSTQQTGKNQSRAKQLTPSLLVRGWVGGTAMLIKKEVFEEIGLLDHNIFMYGEDMEFCLRAKHHHWLSAINQQALIIHLGSASSSSSNAIIGELKGYIYIWAKHKPLWQLRIVKSILQIGILLRLLVFGTMFRNPAKFHAYKKAWSSL